ncbi:hypothetical protein [Holophaga foetida]|nr:hypothetical protein [Holophaga foetida]
MNSELYCTECERYLEPGQLCPCFEGTPGLSEPQNSHPDTDAPGAGKV